MNSQKKELCFDDNTYKLIDTSAFYLKYHKIATYPTLKPTQRGIKFYKNGKVIEFNDYPNNKNAEGTYCINSHNSEMKIYYKHVQGNFWSPRWCERLARTHKQ